MQLSVASISFSENQIKYPTGQSERDVGNQEQQSTNGCTTSTGLKWNLKWKVVSCRPSVPSARKFSLFAKRRLENSGCIPANQRVALARLQSKSGYAPRQLRPSLQIMLTCQSAVVALLHIGFLTPAVGPLRHLLLCDKRPSSAALQHSPPMTGTEPPRLEVQLHLRLQMRHGAGALPDR